MFKRIKNTIAAFKNSETKITNDDKLYYYKGVVERVVDGDTYDIVVSTGFGTYQLIRFRLLGYDTPEPRGEEREAGLMVSGVVKDLIEGKEVILKSTKKGSFQRYLAEIWIDDKNLGEWLLAEGYADVFGK